MRSHLAVIAGPTAVGKGTVVRYICENFPNVHLSVSATTRNPRPGEVDGVDYFFLSHSEFDAMVKSGDMLEYAIVHGENKYGTPRKPVEQALSRGDLVILEIDIQGARQVKKSMPDSRSIFISPPSWDVLVNLLKYPFFIATNSKIGIWATLLRHLEESKRVTFVPKELQPTFAFILLDESKKDQIIFY